ncbi:deoxyribonuclease ii [Aphelenchoides avenae]|nr:deoxyribonuclease ii [Aphelenchus avenae]
MHRDFTRAWTAREFVKSAYPRMQAAAEGKKQSPKGREVQREAKLTSKGGEKFLSFQKNRLFAKDLYADFVASSIRKDMYVETWAKDYLPSAMGPERSVLFKRRAKD